jgi:hypothetical protein
VLAREVTAFNAATTNSSTGDESSAPIVPPCAWEHHCHSLHATASAAEHGTRGQLDTAGADSDLTRAIDEVSADAYPNIHSLRDVIVAGEGSERFRWGVDVLLAGIGDRKNAAVPRAYEPDRRP